jgi:hypothetical protein
MEAFATAIVHGGFFLNFTVSVNWIGPEFQRKVRGAPFHPSFSWSAASLTAATPTIPAMPIAGGADHSPHLFLPRLFLRHARQGARFW